MVISSQRKVRIDPEIDEPMQSDATYTETPEVTVNQTSYPSRDGSSAGYFIAALVVLVAFALALYFGTRSDTVPPTATENNTTETAPATPPATPIQPTQPDTTGQQPNNGGDSGTSGSDNSGSTTAP